MRELEEKKEILLAIKNAIANMNLEEEINIEIDNNDLNQLEEKVLKLGGYKDEMGGLSCK